MNGLGKGLDDNRGEAPRETRDVTRSDDSTRSVLANNMRDNLDSGGAGLAMGEGVGGVGGLAAGAAIGSLAGPVGTLIGAIAGAVGGWWAGREVAETIEGYPTDTDTHYRGHHESGSADTRARFTSYDHARPLYQLGYVAAQNPDYSGRSFADVEPDLQRGWSPDMEQQYGSWNDVRHTVGSAYDDANSPTGDVRRAGSQTVETEHRKDR